MLIFDPPKFSPVKITLKKVHQNDFHFSPIEITSNKASQRDAEFLSIKTKSKKFVEATWKLVDILFSMNRHNIDNESTSIQRVVSVGNSTIHSSSSSY